MIKVAALTAGKKTPSSRFRVRQHICSLGKTGIDVEEIIPLIPKNSLLPLIGGKIRVRYILPIFICWELLKIIARIPSVFRANQANLIWLQRELVPGIISLEFFLRKPYVFDVDDAIWTSKPFGRLCVGLIAKRASRVIVGNQYLAEWFGRYNELIEIVPTAIDIERFYPNPTSKNDHKFVIGWTGTSINFPHLYSIENSLCSFIDKYKNESQIEISIISDKKPSFKNIPHDFIKYTLWTPENEAVIIQGFDIGLMPLIDDEFTRGKCSFKMLQYMAVGLPVVVSPIGMNREILDKGRIGFSAVSLTEWYKAIEFLYENPKERVAMGEEARKIIVRDYSNEVISKKLASIFNEVVFG
jgi:glycosyltransferase involved in cell wall biosynthesis